jgi:ribosome biogenesis protein BMS1
LSLIVILGLVHCWFVPDPAPGVQGVPGGGVRVTFEDKPLLSDLVFLRAWVAVDIPQLYNTMTNLLAPAIKPANAAAVSRKGHSKQLQDGLQQQQQQLPLAAADGDDAVDDCVPAGDGFSPAASFAGARAGFVFKKGESGLGYYRDRGPNKQQQQQLISAHAAATSAGGGGAAADHGSAAAAGDGWVGMRTVAELRRAAGVGAPRLSDSLYR